MDIKGNTIKPGKLSRFTSSTSLIVLCCFLQLSVKAATNIVSNPGDSGPGTLRTVVATAAPGDKIIFTIQGTIFLSSGPIVLDKNLQILGPGKDNLSIDSQKTSHIFLVGSNVTAKVADLTLTNAYNSIFSFEGSGGAVRNLGNLTLTRCVVTESTSEFGEGGGIYTQGNLTVKQCSISNNLATYGGGIFHRGPGKLVIDKSTINANSSLVPGGSGGGGILMTGGGAGLFTNSTISGNFAFNGNGGGILSDTYFRLESCTIVSNTAIAISFLTPIFGEGGGLYVLGVAGRKPEIRNSIVAGNTALRTFGTISQQVGPDIRGTVSSRGWNLIQNPTNAIIVGAPIGNQIGINPLLGPLQDNGGLTLTHALLTNSPAIDTGARVNFPETDQRGIVRPQDGNGDGLARTDIGSFELEAE